MQRAWLVAGLSYGDEGKGTLTDFLVRRHQAGLVVRYNGGAQAAHNVVTDEGVHHTFSQFGAGTLAGAHTHLSRFMLIEPFSLKNEAAVLEDKGVIDIWNTLTIDPEAVVITPWHWYANRLRELARGDARHGSVGLGVGEARSDEMNGLAIRVKDLLDAPTGLLRDVKCRKVLECKEFESYDPDLFGRMKAVSSAILCDRYQEIFKNIRVQSLPEAASNVDNLVFEGAQGVLLDETYGFAPYNTWTDTTFANADVLLDEAGITDRTRVGVIRSYMTRHGYGPFVTEDPELQLPEPHNKPDTWMGSFRTGHFDMVMLKYALTVTGGVDSLAITHIDRKVPCKIAMEYDTGPVLFEMAGTADLTERLLKSKPIYKVYGDFLTETIYAHTRTPIAFTSFGPRAQDKMTIFRDA